MGFAIRAAILVAALSGSAISLHADTNRFVSNNVCRTCHPIIWNTFYKNPHFKSVVAEKEAPENTGCQGCHGPGGNHVDKGGGKTTIKAFSLLPPAETLDACLRSTARRFPAQISATPSTR